jgi:hypothetical protein
LDGIFFGKKKGQLHMDSNFVSFICIFLWDIDRFDLLLLENGSKKQIKNPFGMGGPKRNKIKCF